MKPVRTTDCNREYGPPTDWDEEREGPCGSLHANVNAHGVVSSYWKPGPEEITLMRLGYPIRVSMMSNGRVVPFTLDIAGVIEESSDDAGSEEA